MTEGGEGERVRRKTKTKEGEREGGKGRKERKRHTSLVTVGITGPPMLSKSSDGAQAEKSHVQHVPRAVPEAGQKHVLERPLWSSLWQWRQMAES